MKNIKNFFVKKSAIEYSFSAIVGILVLVLSLANINSEYFKILFWATICFELIIVILFLIKLNRLNKFMMSVSNLVDDSYKTFENALFFENVVLAYSFKKYVAIEYKDIVIARHDSNVFEITRPGYKGNHKIYIKSNLQEILIPVLDNDVAQKILNFLQTKNNSIVFQDKNSEYVPTNLADLMSSSVKSRF
ncbi:hypothetical protein [Anaerorhabdus furcosa]|uniref:Uncharacterized protein n=1 Tax=Anaerorhabdus furcosa TaxID=118967 RepID=A0A1T4Q4S8_9FIRM|nr:hypothetical protein [Anaerorhabdus furcosa]SJZ98780.1 hypothetical protein SAMN02745191_2318 [Anaerorhabdus furcosa]